MSKVYKHIILSFVFVLLINSANAQSKSVTTSPNLDSLINARGTSFNNIKALLEPYSSDSLVLASFLSKSIKASYPLGESYAYNQLGVYCRNISAYDKAIDFHEKGLNIAKANNFIQLQISNLNMLGVVYRRKDAVRTALDYHQEALIIAEQVESKTESVKRSIAVSLNSIGNIYLALEQYQLAIEKFSKSLKIEEELHNLLGLAINYHNIGYAKEGLEDLEQALVHYKKSLSYNTKIASKLGEVICNNSIGRVYIKQNKNKEAIAIIFKTLDAAKNLRDKFHLTGVYTNLGCAYLELGNFKLAEKNLEQSLDLALEYNFKSSIEETYRHFASLEEQKKDFEKAFLYTKKSRKYADELNKEKNFQYINDIIIKYDTEKISDKLSILEKENEIVKLKFKKNKNLLIISFVLLLLILVLMYILYRQRLLKNEKKILTLQQDILSSQMNPHFLFNSLNSIKQYIISNEQKNAVYYLNKFAKLMRKILEASKTKETSLAEELETMKLYFSIENIRFSNEIELDINIDDDLNLDVIKIPSLILQPFIENAIWHGLSSKKDKKIIALEITKTSNKFITISISDNGIGREQSAIIKNNKVIKRKSVGLTLTRDRLANFVKNYKNKFSLTFKDLKDSNNSALGTQVVLELPIK